MRFAPRLFVLLFFASWAASTQAQPKILSAADVNGEYRSGKNKSISILALGHQRLRVQILALWPHRDQFGEDANIGTFDGIARIDTNVAIVSDTEFSSCKFRLTFLDGHRLKVEQQGDDTDCGFGANVDASGIYRRVKKGKPKFGNF